MYLKKSPITPAPNSLVVQKFRLSIYHVAKWKCSASSWYTQCISFYWLCMHFQAHSNPITITYVHWKISSYNFYLQFWKKHPTSISRSEKVLHRTFIWERRSGLLYIKINSKKNPPKFIEFQSRIWEWTSALLVWANGFSGAKNSFFRGS